MSDGRHAATGATGRALLALERLLVRGRSEAAMSSGRQHARTFARQPRACRRRMMTRTQQRRRVGGQQPVGGATDAAAGRMLRQRESGGESGAAQRQLTNTVVLRHGRHQLMV